MPDHDAPSAARSYVRASVGLTAATILAIAAVFIGVAVGSPGPPRPAAFVIGVLVALVLLLLGAVVGCWGASRGLSGGHCGQWSVREMRAFWVTQCVLVCAGVTLLTLSLVFIL